MWPERPEVCSEHVHGSELLGITLREERRTDGDDECCAEKHVGDERTIDLAGDDIEARCCHEAEDGRRPVGVLGDTDASEGQSDEEQEAVGGDPLEDADLVVRHVDARHHGETGDDEAHQNE